ncbi:hypothetical protein NDU88_005332 [Pleurodeles waltl]|uniref:Uncharacterized protein n=1 Tax=Pleurodeles waltl TaxID=8319 RepID=A0AAV7SLH8_PLEWA|nr:hypothetical protein NDU88_005332 [Pleurodeles waltl]
MKNSCSSAGRATHARTVARVITRVCMENLHALVQMRMYQKKLQALVPSRLQWPFSKNDRSQRWGAEILYRSKCPCGTEITVRTALCPISETQNLKRRRLTYK